VFDLTHYGAAEVTAAREGAIGVMAEALVLARGALLKRGFEVAVMPTLERAAGAAGKGKKEGQEVKVRARARARARACVIIGVLRVGYTEVLVVWRLSCAHTTPTHTQTLPPHAHTNPKGPLVVVNRLVVSDLPPVSVVLPDSFAKMGKAVERARRTMAEKSRLELALPVAREEQLFEALAAIGAKPADASGNTSRCEWDEHVAAAAAALLGDLMR